MNRAVIQYLKSKRLAKLPKSLLHGTPTKELRFDRDPIKMSSDRYAWTPKTDLEFGFYTTQDRKVARIFAYGYDIMDTYNYKIDPPLGYIHKFTPRKEATILPYNSDYIGTKDRREHKFSNLGTYIVNEMSKEGILDKMRPEEYLRRLGVQGWRKKNPSYDNVYVFNDLRALSFKSVDGYPKPIDITRQRKKRGY